MKIITQEYVKKQVANWNIREIKFYINRQRLKFTKQEISLYLYILLKHTYDNKYLLTYYKNNKKLKNLITDKGFYKNLLTLSPLIKLLYLKINNKHNIKPTNDYNIVDSTLLSFKQSAFITQNDWKNNKVTTRVKDKIKTYTCGYKGLFFNMML